jgi:acetoin utilization deacetylase AcuC-like enzyme
MQICRLTRSEFLSFFVSFFVSCFIFHCLSHCARIKARVRVLFCIFAVQVGSGAGVGKTINVPLRGMRFGDWEYIKAFQLLLLPVLDQFQPDLIVISAGFDACLGDPLGKMVRFSSVLPGFFFF